MKGCPQLSALLRRGLLAKRANLAGSLLELALPIAFTTLLLLLKDLATVYEAPNIAYSCGPAAPFDLSEPAIPPDGELGRCRRARP